MRSKIVLALLVVSAPASANPLESELPTVREACWSRQYDGAHLARHPGQRVAAIALSKVRDEPGRGVLTLSLLVNLRERAPIMRGEARPYDFASHVLCRPAGSGLSCESESGLGGFRIERANGGLMVKNPGVIRLNPSNYDSEDVAPNHIRLSAKPDDAAWLLDTRGPKPCPF